jgi:acyl carrier protein
LRSFIAEKLPENMVPSAFVVMDEFPLTPNGKVDRKALPAPDSVRPDLKDAYVAPRTPLEEVMVEIWTSVLGIDEVGVDDNFFELGGHSLLATQIISRLRDVFHVELPLTTIFQAPKISEIVKFVEKLLEPQK